MGFGEVIIALAGIGVGGATLITYIVMRADVIKKHGRSEGAGVLQAIEALRREIAALRQHESEAVLSFDSTLQTLDARVKHLEQRVQALGAGERSALGARTAGPEGEPARVAVSASDMPAPRRQG